MYPTMGETFRMTKVIAVVNQKGGVGKTTTAINLAAAMAIVRKRILLIDLDPQGNSSTGLGISLDDRKHNIYTVLAGDSDFAQAVRVSKVVPELHIVPSTVDLAAAEFELAGMEDRENFLKEALAEQLSSYDYVFIDCPPSLGMLTINAMAASHSVIIPLQCEFFSLEGLSHLMQSFKRIRQSYNPNLAIEGILLTMYDKRNRLTIDVEKEVRSHFGRLTFETVIPRNIRMSEAPSHGKPVIIYDHTCTGSKAYMYLAKELLQKQKATETAAAA
jgi:chromosome partitioning protein